MSNLLDGRFVDLESRYTRSNNLSKDITVRPLIGCLVQLYLSLVHLDGSSTCLFLPSEDGDSLSAPIPNDSNRAYNVGKS